MVRSRPPLVALALLLAVAPAAAQREPARGRPILGAMASELERSMARLRLPGFDAPYFISYTVRDYDLVEVAARFGALVADERSRARQAYVEVRVGDYAFDNTADAGGDRDWGADADTLYEPGTELPLDDDPAALRGALWLLTDARYKAALTALNRKRGRRATAVVDDEDLPSFSRAPRVVHADPPTSLSIDRAAWGRRLREASAALRRHPALLDSSVRLQATREVRYLVNSEGSRVVTERTIVGLHVSAVARADDGMLLEHGRSFYGASDRELPPQPELLAAIERVASELDALRRAPLLDPYTGPAILMEEATGVLFHEIVGHRLEGERLGDDGDGRTFRGQLGRRVIPDFLDVVDDPTLRRHGGVSLNGHYRFDDQGVAGRRVALIEQGVLRSFLTSRKPVQGVAESNGHGRAEGALPPMARMSNLVVRSRKGVPHDRLKRMLLEEVRRQGKPFGLIIRDITGGSTNTASYGYQAFKGTPRLVYKVDAKTGEEILVRGVEMVGTPLAAINKIVATGDASAVFNGYCGAESGYVPVSTIAPAVLMSEIELQRVQRTRQRPTILPAPWRDR